MNWAAFLNADSDAINSWLDWYVSLWLVNAKVHFSCTSCFVIYIYIHRERIYQQRYRCRYINILKIHFGILLPNFSYNAMKSCCHYLLRFCNLDSVDPPLRCGSLRDDFYEFVPLTCCSGCPTSYVQVT